MSYMESIEKYLQERKQYGIKPGLERMELLLQALGHPEKQLQIIHIAGTNGKGSTATFMKDVLMNAQYQVGLFTSPSFTGISGYFVINNKPIKNTTLNTLFEEIKPVIHDLDEKGEHPTEFEIITAMALLYYVNRTDIVIVEAGMGGREDTTNVVHPILSLITNVSTDHTAFLGDSLTSIAYHKAGIIKENCPVVIGPMADEALTVCLQEASKKHSVPYVFGRDFRLVMEKDLPYYVDPVTKQTIHVPLAGTYQWQNIALAIKALHIMRDRQYEIADQQISKAMKQFIMPGRFEKVSDHPVVILDSAHNIAGIKALKQSLQETYPNTTIRYLFAVFADKAVDEMIDLLGDKDEEIMVTTFTHERAASLADLKTYKNEKNDVTEDWRKYVKAIMQTKHSDTIYVITGSMHFIMQVRDFMKTMN